MRGINWSDTVFVILALALLFIIVVFGKCNKRIETFQLKEIEGKKIQWIEVKDNSWWTGTNVTFHFSDSTKLNLNGKQFNTK